MLLNLSSQTYISDGCVSSTLTTSTLYTENPFSLRIQEGAIGLFHLRDSLELIGTGTWRVYSTYRSRGTGTVQYSYTYMYCVSTLSILMLRYLECVNADMSMNTYECFYEWQAFPINAYTLRRSPLNQNAIYSWMLNYQRNAMLKLCNPGANLSWMPKYLNFNSIYIRSYQVFITVNTYKYLVMLGLWVNLIKKKLTIL